VTPSENGYTGERDILRSPLAKRKKLAAERTGYSKLKEAITADDLLDDTEAEANSEKGKSRAAALSSPKEEDMEEDEDEGEDDADDEDDFLARELEEDWG
jgi:RNA polymerase II subunit A C-terminal domain phosphatase